MATQIIDDKSEHCVPFILKALDRHVNASETVKEPPTFFIGLNGVQGAGKTTLVGIMTSLSLASLAHSSTSRV